MGAQSNAAEIFVNRVGEGLRAVILRKVFLVLLIKKKTPKQNKNESKMPADVSTLTVHHNLAVCAVVIDLLDVAKVNVTEEDAIGSLPSPAMVVKAESDDILHVVGILKRLYGRVEVRLVGQVDAFQYGTLRVQQVAIVVAATLVVFCQHAMSTGTGALPVATEKTQLFAAAVVFADVGACGERDNKPG